MGKTDPRVDAYIANAQAFARPILKHLRELVHQGCPDANETIKWRIPFFEYKGLLCGFAGFKAHCAFMFWRDVDVVPKTAKTEESMGQLGRITSLAELPGDRVLVGYIKKAAALRDAAPTAKKKAAQAARPPLEVPAELKAALAKNKKAANEFETFTASHQREYIEWITSAKREETRARRIATAIEWITEGKSQNWRYEKP